MGADSPKGTKLQDAIRREADRLLGVNQESETRSRSSTSVESINLVYARTFKVRAYVADLDRRRPKLFSGKLRADGCFWAWPAQADHEPSRSTPVPSHQIVR